MKKLFILALCVVLAAFTVACAADATPATQGDATSTPPATSDSSTTDVVKPLPVDPVTPPDAQSEADDRPLYVADAMQYRGTVIKVTKDVPGKDGATYPLVVTLQQAEGTNFGAPTLQFAITEDTRLGFELDEATLEGRYLEVYYSYMTKNMPNPDEVYTAIAINDYVSEEMVNFNGVVQEIIPHPEKEGEGRFLMNDLHNPTFQVFYLYGPETNFYLNKDEIQVGDKLNIFHSPAMAMSMPPQCFSKEIRNYAESK